MTCSVNKPLFGSPWYITKEMIPSFNFQICWSDKVRFWDAQLRPHSVPTVINGGLSQGQPAVAKTPHRQFLPRGVVLTLACHAASCKTVCSNRFSRTDLCRDNAWFRIDWITYADTFSCVNSVVLNLFVLVLLVCNSFQLLLIKVALRGSEAGKIWFSLKTFHSCNHLNCLVNLLIR